ncbi:MAG: TetR/AcrR family transcriptional regulator [Acidiferrobacter sp.]
MSIKGRPRQFDRNAALEIAMTLFWRYGYEGTSVAHLGQAIGITPPSLYAAFGTKENLYVESVDLYVSTVAMPAIQALNTTNNAKDAIKRFLRLSAKQFTCGVGWGAGCMIASGDLVYAPERAFITKKLADLRAKAEHIICARLKQGVQDKHLPQSTDTTRLAAYFATIIQGMSVQARDGASVSKLYAISDIAIRAWPENT